MNFFNVILQPTNTAADVPTVNLSLNYEEIKVTYSPRKTGWDLATNVGG